MTTIPDLANVKHYLGETSWDDTSIQEALDVETDAQAAECRIPAEYPPALAEALRRRVACNLARRPIPLAVLQGDAEIGSTSAPVPGQDPEVRRLERRHRRWVVA